MVKKNNMMEQGMIQKSKYAWSRENKSNQDRDFKNKNHFVPDQGRRSYLEAGMLKMRLISFGFIIFISIALWPSEVLKNVKAGRYFCVDNDQNIYTHNDSYSVIKYSSKGKPLLIIGRKGEGPGDIKRIGWFEINPKGSMLYVTENVNGNRRISIFSTVNGQYIDNWKFEFDWNKWEGIPNIQFDQQGYVYITPYRSVWRRYKSFSIGAIEKAIIKYSYSGKKLQEIYRMKSDFMAQKPGKGNVTIPYCDYLLWKINNNLIFIKENYKSHISVFDLNGRLIKEIKLPIEKIRLTDKDLDDWENRILSDPVFRQGVKQGWFDLKFWRRNLPFPSYKNLSGSNMYFDSKGYLYSYKFSNDRTKENKWFKIDINTGKNKVIDFPPGYRLRCIKDKYFYFSIINEEDEDDVPKILKIEEDSIPIIK
ncbi:MAG: hypothetical protein JSV88_08900 [Candidatus Aminicenantes bacterium]|nr:MAG: hypothetical protein JSV88_08900 [Candidatus Aminicenantes bacterium]